MGGGIGEKVTADLVMKLKDYQRHLIPQEMENGT